jgi:hypothetical protein
MTRLRKRILVTISILIVVSGISFFFLIKNANEILKTELEKSLGKDFHVERTVLNWGSVDAYGIKLLKDGEEIARAESMSIRADFLSFLKRHYSVSSISFVKPYLKVVIDKQGTLLVPFVNSIGKKGGAEGSKSDTAFAVGRIVINNGQVFLQDERLPATHNTIALKEVDLSFNGLVYPFENSHSGMKLSVVSEGKIISGRVGADGKVNLKTGSLDMHIDGRDLILLDLDTKGPLFSAESMTLSIALKEDGKGKYYFFDKVMLKRPYMLYETDDGGELVSPWKDVIEELQKVYAASGNK